MTVTSMPQPTLPAQPVPDPAEEVVLGVDTHKDVHVAAVRTTLGASLAHQEFPTTAAGYRQLLVWARSFGVVQRAGVECTGSCGTALTRYLRRESVDVVEINQPDRATRRKRGKTDAVDADAAARAVLSGRATTVPKTADGPAADMRILRLAKESAVKARTQALNQLKAVLLAIDPDLRELLAGLSNPALVATCAALDVDDRGEAVFTMRLLARRVQHLSDEVKELTRRTTRAVRSCRPQMLDLVGVGPDSAAVLLIAAGDNPDRITDEASFAALCGVSPVEQSSGKTHRRRLNRGGNRQANAALYRIVMTRIRWDERTQKYLQRRTAEGMSKREIIRCLKRYVARELYRHIRGFCSPHLTTKRCRRVADWAEANNVEIASDQQFMAQRIEAQFTALRYFALDGTDHPTHRAQGSMIRRYIIWRNKNAADKHLKALVSRANAA